MRFQKLFAAVPQAGKTYLIERIADLYHATGKGYVFVYNRGKNADFSTYEEIRFLTVKETAAKYYPDKRDRQNYFINPKIEYFVFRGEEHHVKHINKVLYGKKVFCYRIFGTNEKYLIKCIFNYMAHCLVIFDDARPIFRRLSNEAIELLSRQNHTGRKSVSKNYQGAGVDIAMIYHNLDKVNEEIYDYITHIVMLKCNALPDGKKMSNDRLYREIEQVYNNLMNAEKYTAYLIDTGLHTGEVKSSIINTQKIIQHAKTIG